MKSMHTIAFILLIVGGLNWLLVGLFSWDISHLFAGGMSATVPKIIYILVGLSALFEMFTHKNRCKECVVVKSGADNHSHNSGAQM